MVLDGSLPVQSTIPVTIGHEAVGKIISLGSAVKGFSAGDTIGFLNASGACWECEGCSRHYAQCSSGEL
jgi:D-arabinose 1-dehydrogenase-like Zn-dependent alcohol dehydrogenase